MKGIVLNRTLADKIALEEVILPDLKKDEVLVKIKAAALNHRDEWCRVGLYPNLKDGVVLGSDGSGIVESVGSEVDTEWKGKEVIINPALYWGPNQAVQSKEFEILGMPRNGTLAEFVIVPADRLFEKPSHLSFEQAAALPLAGLTAFRALVYQGEIKSGRKVLITGIGGGVAQFAFQFALAFGAEVYVSSSKPEKIHRAMEQGALGGYNYLEATWTENALAETGGFDLIIDGAAGSGLNDLVAVTKPGGRIVFYGATQGNPGKIEARRIFWNQLKVIGTTMGSDEDFRQMIAFVKDKKIVPVVDSVFSFEDAVKAFDRMRVGAQSGKIVLTP